MLCWLTFWLLQAFFSFKYNFILSVFDVLTAGHYLQMFCIHQYIVCIHSFQTRKKLYLCRFIHDMIIPIACISGAEILNGFVTPFFLSCGSMIYVS